MSYVTESDIRVKSYDPSNLSRASFVQFRASRYIMRLNLTSMLKVMTICIWPELVCSISSVSIHYWPESDIRVISYGRLNFPRVFMFNFMLLDILCAGIGHPSENL